jgi:2-polyprenyl-3-methyl-5-hydroxy-6-metoxy-1,4-benzoquinol methylase
MSVTPRKLVRHGYANIRRALLWVVYQFSTNSYWTLRSRELHKRWFAEKSDYPIYQEFLHAVKARNCLEIGCDGGRLSRGLISHVDKLECQDISAKAIAICRNNFGAEQLARITFRCGSLNSLYAATPPEHFDIVISNAVLSAVKPKDIDNTIRTLVRIAKKIVVSELMPGDRGATYYWFTHDYDRLFAAAGWTMEREVVSGEQRFRLYRPMLTENTDQDITRKVN